MGTINRDSKGMLYGFLGVLAFSFTLPLTRMAVEWINPTLVGLGRALVAAVLAGILLYVKRERLHSWSQVRSLLIVALGVVVGFPLLTSWAMNQLPAIHGALVIALLPLATAGAAVFRAGENPSMRFWAASVTGSLIVLAYAWYAGMGSLQWADLALVGAVLLAAIGYAEGGRLAADMGSWQVISWALVIAAPFLLIPVGLTFSEEIIHAPLSAWLAFGYVSIISQFVGFLWWYGGMALAGVARVSQIQYLQPFFSILWAALLLNEALTPAAVSAALLIVLVVAKGRKTSIKRNAQQVMEK
ncbi:MAG: DMT family transporter [Clostridia bacterium]